MASRDPDGQVKKFILVKVVSMWSLPTTAPLQSFGGSRYYVFSGHHSALHHGIHASPLNQIFLSFQNTHSSIFFDEQVVYQASPLSKRSGHLSQIFPSSLTRCLLCGERTNFCQDNWHCVPTKLWPRHSPTATITPTCVSQVEAHCFLP